MFEATAGSLEECAGKVSATAVTSEECAEMFEETDGNI